MATFCGERYVGVLAACNETAGAVTIMIRNYHDDAVPKSDAQIELDITGLTRLSGE